MLEERLSTRKLYEVARTLRRLPDPGRVSDADWAQVLVCEVRRSLSAVHGGEAGLEPAEAGLTLDEQAGYEATRNEVSAWIDRLLVARALAEARPRVRPARREAAI